MICLGFLISKLTVQYQDKSLVKPFYIFSLQPAGCTPSLRTGQPVSPLQFSWEEITDSHRCSNVNPLTLTLTGYNGSKLILQIINCMYFFKASDSSHHSPVSQCLLSPVIILQSVSLNSSDSSHQCPICPFIIFQSVSLKSSDNSQSVSSHQTSVIILQ